ncbi:hypothetical protein [Nevskia sp.]|uniref:hypothetical protein n=1 Tax=Nevskia sp. TaxID=1929292 RepID=UPI0025E60F95|nr:hypothetical protein [Nevskia sp.]
MNSNHGYQKTRIALAIAATVGAAAAVSLPLTAAAIDRTPGKYVTGDFHNHTTCSDGSISMQRLFRKSTETGPGNYGLDWFVQAGHGGSGNRNCTLAEDESLATPAYPFVAGQGPSTTWLNSGVTVKGNVTGGAGNNRNMWRWQSVQEFQYPQTEYFAALQNRPLFMGIETVVPGHEHTSMAVITGQVPAAIATTPLPVAPPYAPLGNANALAQWEYCFDRNDTDTSRGNTLPQPSTEGNNWNCSVPGSANAGDPNWNATGQKLIPLAGPGVGTRGAQKTIEGIRWMAAFHPNGSYYVPAHLERAGPFNPDGNNGFNVEHLRDMNNAAPRIAFGFETQPGHGASDARGEYNVLRNNFGGTIGRIDSVGGTTYGGTGVYGAQVGGVWDALLGEGRNWWFFASSDWHNRGLFGPDDTRSTQDFYPGEYQRNYTLVSGTDPRPRNALSRRDDNVLINPQTVVDGLRTGNNFASSGDLIDRLSFIACASGRGNGGFRSNAAVEQIALRAAQDNATILNDNCATMGEKLVVSPGSEVVVAIVVRDPNGVNFAPYTFPNPSLLQIGVTQPLNAPVLDHIDVISGLVSGFRTPGTAGYAGEWPRNLNWLRADGTTAGLDVVPAAAKNVSADVARTFSAAGANAWTRVRVGNARNGETFYRMSYRIPAVAASQYLRLRGSNLPASVPFETDADGNPLADVYTNAADPTRLTIPCTTVGTNVPANGVLFTGTNIDGCPNHMEIATGASPIAGQKAVSYDVAAWADLWFYSNPIYVEVSGSTVVAGVQ